MRKETKKQTGSYMLAGVGSMFTAIIVSGFLVGYFFDAIFGTLPWFFIGCGLVGIIGAFVRVHELMNQVERHQEKMKKQSGSEHNESH